MKILITFAFLKRFLNARNFHKQQSFFQVFDFSKSEDAYASYWKKYRCHYENCEIGCTFNGFPPISAWKIPIPPDRFGTLGIGSSGIVNTLGVVC